MIDTRLIERWLPIAALSAESVRERRSLNALPPTTYLHVWWARRPLVASRAAVLASLLPADADRKKFLHVLGIHGDPVEAKKAIEEAKKTGIKVPNPYGYDRAFKYLPDQKDRAWLKTTLGCTPEDYTICDPTAGGGSIPFEAARLGFATLANDLNPVAALILRATVEWPNNFSMALKGEYAALAERWRAIVQERLEPFYPQRDLPNRIDITYLRARTTACTYCDGIIPLSPNWRLDPDGTGVRVVPQSDADMDAGGGPDLFL